jgi:hypothetical protein
MVYYHINVLAIHSIDDMKSNDVNFYCHFDAFVCFAFFKFVVQDTMHEFLA